MLCLYISSHIVGGKNLASVRKTHACLLDRSSKGLVIIITMGFYQPAQTYGV